MALGRQPAPVCAIAGLAVTALMAGVMLLWPSRQPVQDDFFTGDAAFVQISADQDLTASYLRSFCDEETAAVQVLLSGAGSLTRESLLWAANQMDSRLSDVLMLG